MKATITITNLLKALTKCAKAIQPNPIHPTLSNFYLDFRHDTLQVTGSNLKMTIMSQVDCDFKDSFSCLVPSKTFLETIKSLPNQPLELHLSETDITVKSAQGVYKLATEPTGQYPDTVKLGKFSTMFKADTSELKDNIARTIIAVSKDELRPSMTGLLFETENKAIRIVATDAHMLSSTTFNDVEVSDELRVVVPAKEVNAAASIIEAIDVKLSFYENFMKIEDGTTYIYLQLIDAIFPNYKQVVPTNHTCIVEIDRERFSGALRRISNFTNTQTNQIKLTLDKVDGTNRITIGAQDLDMNSEGYETFEVHSENFPTAMNIGFNVKMLMAAVDSYATETITLLMTDPNKAAIIKHETDSQDFVLIMPVVLN